MRISSFNQNLSFNKRLVAKINPYDSSTNYFDFKIFELEKDDKEDMKYFANLQRTPYWEDGPYLYPLRNFAKRPVSRREFYVIEDDDGECFAYGCISKNPKIVLNVDYIVTKNRAKKDIYHEVRHLGKSFMLFFAKLAKKYNANLCVRIPAPTSHGFYSVFGFESSNDEFGAKKINYEDLENIIRKNSDNVNVETIE